MARRQRPAEEGEQVEAAQTNARSIGQRPEQEIRGLGRRRARWRGKLGQLSFDHGTVVIHENGSRTVVTELEVHPLVIVTPGERGHTHLRGRMVESGVGRLDMRGFFPRDDDPSRRSAWTIEIGFGHRA